MSKKQKWSEKKTSLGNAIIIGSVFAVVSLIFGLVIGELSAGGSIGSTISQIFGGSGSGLKINWSELDEVYSKLETNYDGEISKRDVIEGAKKGLTAALGDKYTVYMDTETAKEFDNSLHGNVGSGVGIEMGLRDGYVRVLRTLPDNPARAAGVLAGDIIYKVDGEEVYTLSSDEISTKIRGEAGTEVTLTVVRNGEELSFTLKREKINNVSAYLDYDGQTAIITVTRFDEDTGTTVQKFAKEFESKGINKVILDLRDNGGGYVKAAGDLLSLWLDGDVYLIQKSKNQKQDIPSYTASSRAILKDMKTIVLVNGSTASASEITAGALQDYGKATILGEKTYGKGVVQSLYTLSNSTLIKITTASWYTPKERTINGEGITPDQEVTRSYDDINMMRDPQMDAAKAL